MELTGIRISRRKVFNITSNDVGTSRVANRGKVSGKCCFHWDEAREGLKLE